MITEDYCSQEVVKLLEEKGFNNTSTIESITYNKLTKTLDFTYYKYVEGAKTLVTDNIDPSDLTHIWRDGKVTQQMAMKWLREEHNIIIVIEPHSFNLMEEKASSYDFTIWCGDNYEHPLTTNYPTYKETVDAALKHSLENLI